MAEVAAAEFSGADEVEAFRVAYLGRKGKMKDLMAAFKEVPGDQKRELGPMLNALKQAVEDKVKAASTDGSSKVKASGLDATRPSRRCASGHPPSLASRPPGNRRHLPKHGVCRGGRSRN